MNYRLFVKGVAIFAIIFAVALPRAPAGAFVASELPVFTDFVNAVMDGQPEVIRGIYAPNVMAFPVVQQPKDDASAVSENPGEVTQFNAAARHQVIGLLAHNTLAGASFSNLSIGQEVRIIYGNAQVKYFVVDHLYRFKVTQPDKRKLGYLDLSTKKIYDTQEIFGRFYQGNFHVTFQTCIQLGDDTSWGRLFITAIPVPQSFYNSLRALNLPELQSNMAIIQALQLSNGAPLLK